MRRIFNPNLLAATAIIAAIILYGSLYPFVFRQQHLGLGPLRTLLATWALPPRRGDFLANILLYVPLGFFCLSAMRVELGLKRRLLVTLLVGGILSVGIELAQYYAPRVPAARDVYANLLGTAIGAVAGAIFGPGLRWPFVDGAVAKPFPSLVLAAWIGYRLSPFVPAIDLHKYWNALKPLVLAPSLPIYDFYRHTVSWLVVCALLEAIAEKNRSLRLFPVFAIGIMFAKILIVGKVLSWAEIMGAVAGFALWLPLINRPYRVRAVVIAALLGFYVLSWRLEPFQFAGRAGEFGWIPFLSLMRGSLFVNVQSFFEKMFYYGALLWLITAAGVRLRTATISVALVLLATSIAEVYLPGRSAEATDAFMVLVVAAMVALLTPAETPLGARAASPVRNT